MKEKLELEAWLSYESQRWCGRGRVYASVRPLAVKRPREVTARLAAMVAISGEGDNLVKDTDIDG